jgi:AraC family transcriptional regulator
MMSEVRVSGVAAGASPSVAFSPPEIVRRRHAQWRGLAVETVDVTRTIPFDYGLTSSSHLLIASERAERHDGETLVEGLPPSTLRVFSHKLSFIPAGLRFSGWQSPRLLTSVAYFHIDPAVPLLDPELRFTERPLKPRLFFEDAALWATAAKLKALIGTQGQQNALYAEALSVVLLHELLRQDAGVAPGAPAVQGGLAPWQQRRVTEFIEEHLAEELSLATLAGLARLSPFHFARAFKQALGTPPHRYHTERRIERAKSLLAGDALSVTEIALAVGFGETSSFTAAFRRLTGVTPSGYRRGLL